MGRALIGNFKGPKGDKGDPGPQGPAGPQGPVGLVNGDGAVEFEDYTSEGAELPAPEDALAAVTSGRSLKSIFSGIRAFCKNMLDSESGSRKMIGDAFSEEQTYVAGEYAIYDNVLYKFTAAKAAGTWNPDVAAPTTIAEVVRELNGNMSHVGTIIHSTTLDTMEKVIAVYGGTEWQRIEGRFLLGASGSCKNGSTGGESEHKLTVQEMPSHTHYLPKFAVATDNSKSITQRNTTTGVCNSTGFISETSAAGNGKSHNNMPPYRAVYIWERTA